MAVDMSMTYDNQGGKRRVITDLIKMIDPSSAPLLDLLGLTNAKKFGMEDWPNPGVNSKYEWQEQEMAPRAGTLDAAIADGVATSMVVQTGEGDYLRTGHVVKIEDELVWVVSVATDTATVIRGWGSTTGVAHADDTAWEVIGTAAIEGADSVTGYRSEPTQPYNYRQIFEEAVDASGSQLVTNDYGIPDSMARDIAFLIGGGSEIGAKGKAGKLAIQLCRTAYEGTRLAGTRTTAGGMGGIETFVTTNVNDLSDAAITVDVLNEMVESCWQAGGDPDTILCNSYVKRKISGFWEEAVRYDSNEMRGGQHITSFMSDLGIVVDVVVDRWCPPTKAYVIEKDYMGWITYRPWAIEDRASVGDYVMKDVLGEFGFVLCNEKAHGVIKGISQTL